MNSLIAYPLRKLETLSISDLLFSDTRAAPLWLFVRIYLGWQWIQAGWHKVNDPAWMNGGEAIKGFWESAIIIPPQGRPPIAYDWYRDFLNLMLQTESHTWFAPLVVWGELLVGIGLILGTLVGVTAFFGAFMNWNYIMAGSASTNAMLLILAILLMLSWKVAGHIGLDRYLFRAFSRISNPDTQPSHTPPTTSPTM